MRRLPWPPPRSTPPSPLAARPLDGAPWSYGSARALLERVTAAPSAASLIARGVSKPSAPCASLGCDLRRATDLPPSLHLEQATGLILRTANHMDATPAEDSYAAAFLDCDLHTLGAAPHTYHRYAEGVRLEYAHVDEAEYRRGRAAVLRSFPETNEHLYFTPSMRDEREAMAHANIAAEIRLLQAQAD